jgi:hypothetical protein
MKLGFHLWMLKPKSSKSSECTHIYQTNLKSLHKRLPAIKLIATVFWDRKRSADGGIHATRDYNNAITVLRNTKQIAQGHSEQNRGMLTYSVFVVLLHDNARPHTAARTRALLNWELFDHSLYSPLISLRATTSSLRIWRTGWGDGASTIMRSRWIASKRAWAQRRHTSLTWAYKNLISDMNSALILAATISRSSLSMYAFFVYNNIFSSHFLFC